MEMDIYLLAILVLGILAVSLIAYRILAFRGSMDGRVGYDVGACRTIGSREVQEDSYGIVEDGDGIMAVLADGMGNSYGGRIAGRVAVEAFEDMFRDSGAFYNPQYYFRKAFHAANRNILECLNGERGAASVAAVLIKNSIGLLLLLLLLAICLVPLAKLFLIACVMKGSAALAGIVSDRRITGCTDRVGDGSLLLFRTAFTAVALFLIVIAVVAYTTGKI